MKNITILMLYFVCYIPVLFFTAFMPYITRKTDSFGVSMPQEEYDNPEVIGIRKSYRNSVLAFGVVLAVFALVTAFSGREQAMLVFLPVGTCIQLAVMFIFYMVGHRRMKALKQKSNWLSQKPQLVVVDTGFWSKKVMVSPVWFMLYAVVILATVLMGFFLYDKMPDRVPMHYNIKGEVDRYVDKSYKILFFAPVMQMFFTFIMAFVYWAVGKAKQQVDAADPEKSIEQNRIFRYRWSAYTVFMGLAMLLMFGFMQYSMAGLVTDSRVIMGVILGVTGIAITGSIVLSITTGQGGSRVGISRKNTAGDAVNRDDDKHWKLGMFYYNPDDPAVFVEKRFGIGITNNFARPLSWVMIIGLVVFIALFIFVVTKLAG